MLMKTRSVGEMLVVEPQEERLDASSFASFKEQIQESIRQGKVRLVLNLSKVEFIDSSGLTALVSLLKNLGQRGRLVVCGPGPNTANLFRLTRF